MNRFNLIPIFNSFYSFYAYRLIHLRCINCHFLHVDSMFLIITWWPPVPIFVLLISYLDRWAFVYSHKSLANLLEPWCVQCAFGIRTSAYSALANQKCIEINRNAEKPETNTGKHRSNGQRTSYGNKKKINKNYNKNSMGHGACCLLLDK